MEHDGLCPRPIWGEGRVIGWSLRSFVPQTGPTELIFGTGLFQRLLVLQLCAVAPLFVQEIEGEDRGTTEGAAARHIQPGRLVFFVLFLVLGGNCRLLARARVSACSRGPGHGQLTDTEQTQKDQCG
jgi:hypothetical protein